MRLIISMGFPKSDFNKHEEGFRFDGAVIQVIDWEKKSVVREIKFTSPEENIGNGLSRQFKGASIYNGNYFVVTNTEVLIYEMQDWQVKKVITHPLFNDLHGVLATQDHIHVCNTGLEMIQSVDYEGNILNEINLASTPTFERFDRDIDYRQVASTKPHEVHVNHLFLLDGSLWATLGTQRKAVNVNDFSDQLVFDNLFMEGQMILCHDGIVKNDNVIFTTVNGHLIIMNWRENKVVCDIDFSELNFNNRAFGWMRGMEIVDDSVFIGLTKLRNSKFKEYTNWFLKNEKIIMPSSVIEYSMKKEKIVDWYEIENNNGSAIYTIIKDPTC